MSVENSKYIASMLAMGSARSTLTWPIETYCSIAKEIGCQGLEVVPLHRATGDLLHMTSEELSQTPVPLMGGHVGPNPAEFYKILFHGKDPLRPGERLSPFFAGFSDIRVGEKMLKKLSAELGDRFYLVGYPQMDFDGASYGHFDQYLIQTHPNVFNDLRDPEALIKTVHDSKNVSGIVVDIAHIGEPALVKGQAVYPLGEKPSELVRSASTLVESGVVNLLHFQIGRTVKDYKGPAGLESLRLWLNNKQRGDWTEEIVSQAKSYGIPIVVEVRFSNLSLALDKVIPFPTQVTLMGEIVEKLKQVA